MYRHVTHLRPLLLIYAMLLPISNLNNCLSLILIYVLKWYYVSIWHKIGEFATFNLQVSPVGVNIKMPTYCLLPLAYFSGPTEDRMPTRLTSFPRLVLRKLSYRVYENIPILRLYKAADRSNLLFVCITAGTCAKCMRVFNVPRYSVWFTINKSRERHRWEITCFFQHRFITPFS